MALGDTLGKELMAWIGLAITIVIGSVVLLKFKNVSGVTSALNTTIDTFITALSEPKNWVAIVIIAVIGFAVLKIFSKTGKKGRR